MALRTQQVRKTAGFATRRYEENRTSLTLRRQWRARAGKVDESGEGYLYPAKFFMRIELSQPIESAIRRAAG
jgi:hypothetical protein